jgi:hypothetical protein
MAVFKPPHMRSVASGSSSATFTGECVIATLVWPGYCLCLVVHGNDAGRMNHSLID